MLANRTDSMNLASTTFTQLVRKYPKFGEMTQNNGHYRRSRSFKVTNFCTNKNCRV